jgi:RimJ/RimL family protein N-acetyltransferase
MDGDIAFRELAREDLPFFLDVRNECRAMLHDDRIFTLAESEAWFDRDRPEYFLILRNGVRVGYFRVSNRDPERRSLYVGADLHKDFRGLGIARPAYQAFLRMLRVEQGIQVAELEVLSHNVVAHALYRKLGFVEVARKRNALVRDGYSTDSIVMRLELR